MTEQEICSRQTKAQYILNTVFKAIQSAPPDLKEIPSVLRALAWQCLLLLRGPWAGPETVWWRNVGASGVRETGKQRKKQKTIVQGLYRLNLQVHTS